LCGIREREVTKRGSDIGISTGSPRRGVTSVFRLAPSRLGRYRGMLLRG